jgi:hypothetical protein
MTPADAFLEHILGLLEISLIDYPDHPICLALDSNGIDSASGLSLIDPQNLASLSYMDSSGIFKTLKFVHRQLLLVLSGFAVHFEHTHNRPMNTGDWLATTVNDTMTYFMDSHAFKIYRKAYQYSLLAGCTTKATANNLAHVMACSTHHVTPSLGEDMKASARHGPRRNHMVTTAHVDTDVASAHVSPLLGEDVVNSAVHCSNQRPHIDMSHCPTDKVQGINCHQLVQTTKKTMDDCAASTVKAPTPPGINCHQLVQTKTMDDCAAYTVKAPSPGINCHDQLVQTKTMDDDCAAYNVKDMTASARYGPRPNHMVTTAHVDTDQASAQVPPHIDMEDHCPTAKAQGINCHQLVHSTKTVDDCAAYIGSRTLGSITVTPQPSTSTVLMLQDGELLPSVSTGIAATCHYAHPVSDTGLAALHGEAGKDTSPYYAHPVSDTGLAAHHGEAGKDRSHYAHPVSNTGLAALHGEAGKDSSHYAHPVSDTGLAALHGEDASPTTLDPGILDGGELNHHHDAEDDPLVTLVLDWGPLMELPDDDNAGKSLFCDTKEQEEEVMLFYGNWSPPKNPHGEPPCQHLDDEELTASGVELTPTEVKVLTNLMNTGMLKTCSEEDRMPPVTGEDKVHVLSHPLDDTKKLPAADMMFVLVTADDGMLQHITSCPKDGELAFAYGEPPPHDHHADEELHLVIFPYGTKLGKFPEKIGTRGLLPEMDGGCNYPPPEAMQPPLPEPEPPPLMCRKSFRRIEDTHACHLRERSLELDTPIWTRLVNCVTYVHYFLHCWMFMWIGEY